MSLSVEYFLIVRIKLHSITFYVSFNCFFNAKYNIYNSKANMCFGKLELFRKYFEHLFDLN
jgi:hypothetical protein